MDGVSAENWEIIKRCLPDGWESKALEFGALLRKRKIESADELLRLLLIHLATDKSMRTSVTYACQAELCEITDVALLHRLKASGEWLRWMCRALLPATVFSRGLETAARFRVLVVDASTVSEPGSTGTDWRLHYAFELNSFRCESFLITTKKTGESFEHFAAVEGDLVMGDRGYCKRKGICHMLKQSANVLVRLHSTTLPLRSVKGGQWRVLDHLRVLSEGEVGDWDVWIEDPGDHHLVKGRLCSLRKSEEAFQLAVKKWRREAKKKGYAVKDETIEHARYVSVFTTANRHRLTGTEVLDLYRSRWQIELVFKRLKGIVGLGHLPKLNEESCRAWLYGKMFVALLTERLCREAQFFSPWGYPIEIEHRRGAQAEASAQSVAGV
jgi:hypothetical protein